MRHQAEAAALRRGVDQRPKNAFIRSLQSQTYGSFLAQCERMHLTEGQRIYSAGVAIEWVYFPEGAVLAQLNAGADGEASLAFMVGAEGAVGLSTACVKGSAAGECIVQLPGPAWRVPMEVCRLTLRQSPDFATCVITLAELQLTESRLTAFCVNGHSNEQRLALWLGEIHERSGGLNPLPVTHGLIAEALGMPQTTVSTLAARLKADGILTSRRGNLTINNTRLLEKRACSCRLRHFEARRRLGLAVPYVD